MIVDLYPSEEQTLIADSVAALLAARLPVERVHEAAQQGGAAERAAWDELVGLGLFGLGVAEARGGLGLGAAEEAMAARLLGRHLVSPSVLAQMAAPHVADDAAPLVDGSRRAAFANALAGGRMQVIDGGGATLALLLGDGVALVSLRGEQKPVEALDETLRLSHAEIAAPPAERSDEADRVSLLIAGYLTGIAAAAQDMAVDYAKTREQFGQPIGAFQAIKHQCADMAVRSAAAEAQLFHAAVTFGLPGTRAEVAAARLLAGQAALANAKANIQVHGGMGFTSEANAHLYLKRAHVMAMLGSSRRAEQKRVLGA